MIVFARLGCTTRHATLSIHTSELRSSSVIDDFPIMACILMVHFSIMSIESLASILFVSNSTPWKMRTVPDFVFFMTSGIPR